MGKKIWGQEGGTEQQGGTNAECNLCVNCSGFSLRYSTMCPLSAWYGKRQRNHMKGKVGNDCNPFPRKTWNMVRLRTGRQAGMNPEPRQHGTPQSSSSGRARQKQQLTHGAFPPLTRSWQGKALSGANFRAQRRKEQAKGRYCFVLVVFDADLPDDSTRADSRGR